LSKINLDSQDSIYISVSLIDDKEMQVLNKKYRNKDFSTDVLSFDINQDMHDDAGYYYLGDIIVNKDQAKQQAADNDNSLEEEVSALVAHGVLHLLGVHHD
jgi:probable rRNA maturation factor